MPRAPLAWKPWPRKETFSNQIQIYRLDIINKFKPTIDSGFVVSI